LEKGNEKDLNTVGVQNSSKGGKTGRILGEGPGGETKLNRKAPNAKRERGHFFLVGQKT